MCLFPCSFTLLFNLFRINTQFLLKYQFGITLTQLTLFSCLLMINTTKEFLNFNLTLKLHHSVNNSLWTRRATWDIYIHWDDLINTTHNMIAIFERTTRNSASTNSYNILRFCHLIIQTFQCWCHFISNSTCTHNQVCLTRRVTCNLKPKTREVVTCTTNSHKLNTTTRSSESQ